MSPLQFTAQQGDDTIRARRDEVLAAVGDSINLVDVRSPAEFAGEIISPSGYEQEGAQRGGHIPGAASIPWAQAVNEDGTFKSAEDLRELYGSKGVLDGKDVIAYCRIGERSAHTWFVLHELLGSEHVKNYDGSWTEWGSLVGVPVATGRRAPERPTSTTSGLPLWACGRSTAASVNGAAVEQRRGPYEQVLQDSRGRTPDQLTIEHVGVGLESRTRGVPCVCVSLQP